MSKINKAFTELNKLSTNDKLITNSKNLHNHSKNKKSQTHLSLSEKKTIKAPDVSDKISKKQEKEIDNSSQNMYFNQQIQSKNSTEELKEEIIPSVKNLESENTNTNHESNPSKDNFKKMEMMNDDENYVMTKEKLKNMKLKNEKLKNEKLKNEKLKNEKLKNEKLKNEKLKEIILRNQDNNIETTNTGKPERIEDNTSKQEGEIVEDHPRKRYKCCYCG
ncbi:hypothetical protein COBT_003721, partial [Conglomerata obtusa]